MTLVALGLLLGMVGLLWTMVIEIAQADHQTKRQNSRGEGQTVLGGDSSYGFSSQPVRHRRQNVECEEDCFRGSAVFTPSLHLAAYYECEQVEKDIGTTFSLPSSEGGMHMDLVYLAIVAIFFLLSGWLISALERL
ncbi:MAG TPA: hypothetical protein VK901_10955 [Nitrospiraceae bacterium]|nr:hypothetical protein [Nitrospiraceae bacterium]